MHVYCYEYVNVYLLGKANDFSSRGGRAGHGFAGRVGPCYGLAMTGDEHRRSEIKRRVRGAAIGLAIGQAIFGALLLYGIYAPEPTVLKAAAFFLIGWGPVGVIMTYSELDQELGPDTEIWGSVSGLVIMAVLGFLGWYL